MNKIVVGGELVPFAEGAKAPNSGLAFASVLADALATEPVRSGIAIDVGAGYYGVLGGQFAVFGWRVYLVEPNPIATAYLRQHFPFPNSVIVEDTASRGLHIPHRADWIVSNPAQMPPPDGTRSVSWNHDYSENNGFAMMRDVFGLAAVLLDVGGLLSLLVFGFHRARCLAHAGQNDLRVVAESSVPKAISDSGYLASNWARCCELFPEYDWQSARDERQLPASVITFAKGRAASRSRSV